MAPMKYHETHFTAIEYNAVKANNYNLKNNTQALLLPHGGKSQGGIFPEKCI